MIASYTIQRGGGLGADFSLPTIATAESPPPTPEPAAPALALQAAPLPPAAPAAPGATWSMPPIAGRSYSGATAAAYAAKKKKAAGGGRQRGPAACPEALRQACYDGELAVVRRRLCLGFPLPSWL